MLKWIEVIQYQVVLEETEDLFPFHCGFRPEFWMETALVILIDDVGWESDGECVPVVSSRPLFSFSTIDHAEMLAGLEMECIRPWWWWWWCCVMAIQVMTFMLWGPARLILAPSPSCLMWM